jgi:hypothetical protein
MVSETRKALRWIDLPLEMVSPALGILLVQDDEIRAGASPDTAVEHVSRLLAAAEADLLRRHRRIAPSTFEQPRRCTRVTLSRPAP